MMGQRNLSRTRNRSTTDQPSIGNCMVRRAIGAVSDQPEARIQHASDAMDFCGLQSFLEGKRRQDCRYTLRQHRLARPRWADHQDVVSTCARNFQCALGRHLTANVFEVNREMLYLTEYLLGIELNRGNAIALVEKVDHLQH